MATIVKCGNQKSTENVKPIKKIFKRDEIKKLLNCEDFKVQQILDNKSIIYRDHTHYNSNLVENQMASLILNSNLKTNITIYGDALICETKQIDIELLR